jgi:hypothetical protein
MFHNFLCKYQKLCQESCYIIDIIEKFNKKTTLVRVFHFTKTGFSSSHSDSYRDSIIISHG